MRVYLIDFLYLAIPIWGSYGLFKYWAADNSLDEEVEALKLLAGFVTIFSFLTIYFTRKSIAIENDYEEDSIVNIAAG